MDRESMCVVDGGTGGHLYGRSGSSALIVI
jgi:hypothetical protein